MGDSSLFVSSAEADFEFGGRAFVAFSIGITAAVARFLDIEQPLLGISPLILIESGYRDDKISLSGSFSIGKEKEKRLKAVPNVGVSVRWDISTLIAAEMSLWATMSEYLMDPWFVIESAGASLSLVFKEEDEK